MPRPARRPSKKISRAAKPINSRAVTTSHQLPRSATTDSDRLHQDAWWVACIVLVPIFPLHWAVSTVVSLWAHRGMGACLFAHYGVEFGKDSLGGDRTE